MVYGDQGSSLALVSRNAFSLSCLGTVALITLTLRPSSRALSLNIPSLSAAAEGGLVFVAEVLGFSGRLIEGIAGSWVSFLDTVSRAGNTRLASRLNMQNWRRFYIFVMEGSPQVSSLGGKESDACRGAVELLPCIHAGNPHRGRQKRSCALFAKGTLGPSSRIGQILSQLVRIRRRSRSESVTAGPGVQTSCSDLQDFSRGA